MFFFLVIGKIRKKIWTFYNQKIIKLAIDGPESWKKSEKNSEIYFDERSGNNPVKDSEKKQN